jgi:hypothetical protein
LTKDSAEDAHYPQCDDREKVLYAAGRLQGSAAAWWDAYSAAHVAPKTITWEEFTTNFRSHHIPYGVMKIKKKEFLSLKQGGMSLAEYRDKFTEFSRYAAEEVAEDRKKQELFLVGLAGSMQYQLMSYAFPNFQQLVDAAIRLEHKRKELGEQKRKAASSGQFGTVSRPRFNPPPNTPFRFGGPVETLGSSSPNVLLSNSSSLLSSFSVLSLRLHA